MKKHVNEVCCLLTSTHSVDCVLAVQSFMRHCFEAHGWESVCFNYRGCAGTELEVPLWREMLGTQHSCCGLCSLSSFLLRMVESPWVLCLRHSRSSPCSGSYPGPLSPSTPFGGGVLSGGYDPHQVCVGGLPIPLSPSVCSTLL